MKILADKHIPHIAEAIAGLGEAVIKHGSEMTAQDFKDIDAYLGRSVRKIGVAELEGSSLQYVSTASAGFEHVDTAYLASRGIEFVSAAGCNATSVADYVLAALLELACERGFSLSGKSIGVVGVGNVGKRVALRCEALGMKVVRNDPPLERETGNKIYRPIEEVQQCDIITFHTPLIKSGPYKTLGLFDSTFAAKMKQGTILINASRGAVTDTNAVLDSIASGKISDAVIDVWEGEPSISFELLGAAYIATPHIAGHALDSKVRAMRMVVDGLCRHFGIEKRINESDYLPAPELPELTIKTSGESLEQTLLGAVRRVYDIRRDDAALRECMAMDKARAATHFDMLRKNYPVRRELRNTQITCGAELSGPFDAVFGHIESRHFG
ncbi:MAG: 4-phosphoerythronate dehydrogenase [Phycisphaerae bacterium]